jgi:hypothetical protein
MQMNKAGKLPIFGHHQLGDVALLHAGQGFGRKVVHVDGSGVGREDVAGPQLLQVGEAAQHAPQVAVGDDAGQGPARG